MTVTRCRVAGAILAGGKATRMGGEKALAPLLSRPLIAHVAAVLRPDVELLAVVGNRQAAASIEAEFLHDETDDSPGPLVGVLAALDWAAEAGAEWLIVLPCDTPLLPSDLVRRLLEEASRSGVVFAKTQDGPHALVAAWRTELRGPLRALMAAGHPAVRDVMNEFGAVPVHFDDDTAFLNANTPADLARAEQLLLRRPPALPLPRS